MSMSPEMMKLSGTVELKLGGTVDQTWNNFVSATANGIAERRPVFLCALKMAFAAGWRREVENYLDMSHFAFAHSSTLGVSADPRIRGMEITIEPDGGYRMDAPFPALNNDHEMPGKLQSAHHRRQRSFSVVRLHSANRIAAITNRVITFGSLQPISSKALKRCSSRQNSVSRPHSR